MIDIERLGPDAWDIYRNLRLASLSDSPSAFGSRLDAERLMTASRWRARLENRTQFVAREDGVPVGTVGWRTQMDGPAELVSMWVARSARGTGVADRLVDAVLDDALDRGLATLVLWVTEGNEPAERLYARHGFARTGRTQPIDDDDPVRGIEFEMRRGDPSRS